MRSLGFLSGYVVGVMTIVGCASTNFFPWRYYATQMPDECYDKGTMLGKDGLDGWGDLPLSECKPGSAVKLRCITTTVDDFYAIKADNIRCHNALDACMKGPNPLPSAAP